MPFPVLGRLIFLRLERSWMDKQGLLIVYGPLSSFEPIMLTQMNIFRDNHFIPICSINEVDLKHILVANNRESVMLLYVCRVNLLRTIEVMLLQINNINNA